MALEGTLKDFALPDIFQLIGLQKKTGMLYLKNDEAAKSGLEAEMNDDSMAVGTGASQDIEAGFGRLQRVWFWFVLFGVVLLVAKWLPLFVPALAPMGLVTSKLSTAGAWVSIGIGAAFGLVGDVIAAFFAASPIIVAIIIVAAATVPGVVSNMITQRRHGKELKNHEHPKPEDGTS